MKIALFLAGVLVLGSDSVKKRDPALTARDVRAGIERALSFLLLDQNDDGSWGSWRKPAHGVWSNIKTHKAWIAATTGIVCTSLIDLERDADSKTEKAFLAGIDFLLREGATERPSGWDVDNTWAFVYTLETAARSVTHPWIAGTPREEKLRKFGSQIIKKFGSYQTPGGGWGYYDDPPYTVRPKWATSFMTAAAVLALTDARKAGFDVDDELLARAVIALKRCRLPNGAYSYSVEAVPSPGGLENIDQIKGSLSRIQVGNLALLKAGAVTAGVKMTGVKMTREELRAGLDLFFKHHRFLKIARGRPIPHETYYYNSGYFYFFGHYYAAGVIEELDPKERDAYWNLLREAVIRTQEKDGSMWDYYFNTYHRAYGTAWGMSVLARSLHREGDTIRILPLNN